MGIITGTNYVSQYSGDEIDAALTAATNAGQVDGVLEGAGDGTFSAKNVDASPTMGSDALVESGGVYSAIAGKQDALTFDNAPVEGSVNPVKSGGIYNSVEELRGLIYDLMPRKSLPSAPIHAFSDGADGIPIKAMSVAVSAVQSGSGTPAPDNVRPISGWSEAKIVGSGKNLAYPSTYNIYNGGRLIPVKSGDTVYVYGEWTSSGSSSSMWGAIFATPDETNKNNYIEKLTDASSGVVKTYNITTDGWFGFCYNVGVSYYTITKMMIALEPITADDYVPYVGSLVTIAFGSTVYGGTLVYKGGKEWEFTATHAVVDMGTLNYSKGTFFSSSGIATTVKKPPSNDSVADILCSTFATKSRGALANEDGISVQTDGAVVIKSTPYADTSAADFKTAMDGQKLVYELATPLAPITLTADAECVTQYGDNVMFADCGDSELTYRQDIGLLLSE